MRWDDLREGDVLIVSRPNDIDVRVIVLLELELSAEMCNVELVNLQNGRRSEHVRLKLTDISKVYTVLRGANVEQQGV